MPRNPFSLATYLGLHLSLPSLYSLHNLLSEPDQKFNLFCFPSFLILALIQLSTFRSSFRSAYALRPNYFVYMAPLNISRLMSCDMNPSVLITLWFIQLPLGAYTTYIDISNSLSLLPRQHVMPLLLYVSFCL